MTKPGVNGTARRRLLTGGLAAAPVALTLVSRPVLGFTCANASALASAGSQRNAQATFCSGRTPEFWVKQQANWPAPFVGSASDGPKSNSATTGINASQKSNREATPFHCPITGFNGTQFSGKSMLKVLENRSGVGAHGELAAYLAAAMLNACAGLTPVLDGNGVRRIWNQYITAGYFEPTTGVTWQAPQIIAWLKTTMEA